MLSYLMPLPSGKPKLVSMFRRLQMYTGENFIAYFCVVLELDIWGSATKG